jgi:hypothetical protein
MTFTFVFTIRTVGFFTYLHSDNHVAEHEENKKEGLVHEVFTLDIYNSSQRKLVYNVVTLMTVGI